MEDNNGDDEPINPKFRSIADLIMNDDDDPEKNHKKKRLKTTSSEAAKGKIENRKDEEEPPPGPPPVFHPTILEEIDDDAHPVFLFEKGIKRSDLNKHLCRFRITKTKIVKLLEFLTEEEKDKLEKDYEKGLTVIAREVESGGEYTMHLTKDKKEDDILVLKNEWRKFVLDHNLKLFDSIQAWGYRRGGDEFRFALDFIKNPHQD